MANHTRPIPAPTPPPPVRWVSLVETAEGWHLATMTTVGGKQQDQHLGEATDRASAEEQVRAWVGVNLMGWSDE